MFESSGLFVDRPFDAGGIPLNGLIAQWIMDDAHIGGGGGTTVFDSIGSNNGTINDLPSVTSAAGPGSHTARQFTGTSGVANISLISNPLNWEDAGVAWSVAGWIYLNDNSVTGVGGFRQTFMGSGYGGGAPKGLRILNDITTGNGCLGVGYHSASGGAGYDMAAGSIPNTTWTHFVFTNDGSGGGGNAAVTLGYLNGGSVSLSAVNTAASLDGSSNSRLASIDGGEGGFAGRMYNWLVYNRVITAQEALNIFNAQ